MSIPSHLYASGGNAEQQTSGEVGVNDEAVAGLSVGDSQAADAVGLKIPFLDASVAEALSAKVAQFSHLDAGGALDPVECDSDVSDEPLDTLVARASGADVSDVSVDSLEPLGEAKALANVSDLSPDTLAAGTSDAGNTVAAISPLEPLGGDGDVSNSEGSVDENLGDVIVLWEVNEDSSTESSGDELTAAELEALRADIEAGSSRCSELDNEKVCSIFAAIHSSKQGNRKKARHKVAKFVIDNPRLVNQDWSNGFTILHGAVFSGDRRLVRFLSRNGANPNAKTNAGYSPLDVALCYDYAGIASDLAEFGARCSDESFPLGSLEHRFQQKGRACRDMLRVISHTNGHKSEAAEGD